MRRVRNGKVERDLRRVCKEIANDREFEPLGGLHGSPSEKSIRLFFESTGDQDFRRRRRRSIPEPRDLTAGKGMFFRRRSEPILRNRS